jgi:hypothetical protein
MAGVLGTGSEGVVGVGGIGVRGTGTNGVLGQAEDAKGFGVRANGFSDSTLALQVEGKVHISRSGKSTILGPRAVTDHLREPGINFSTRARNSCASWQVAVEGHAIGVRRSCLGIALTATSIRCS